MIIVEGMDATGKTTLADRLREALEISCLDYDAPPKSEEASRFLVLQSILHTLDPDCVQERAAYISEAVYGPILEGREIISLGEAIKLTDALRPFVIYCVPRGLPHEPTEHDNAEQMAKAEELRDKIEERYVLFCESLQQRPWYYHGEPGELPRLVKAINKWRFR